MNRVGATDADVAPGVMLAAAALPSDAVMLMIAAGLLALTLVAWLIGTALAVRALRAQQQLREQARDARARWLALNELLEVGLWQTDSQHRLVVLQAPPGASMAMAPQPTMHPGPLLWERFEPADPQALHARLDRGAALDDIGVRLDVAAAQPCAAVLRGRACTDADGRFAGYLGTWRTADINTNAEPRTVSAAQPSMAVETLAPADAPPPEGDHESFSFTISHDLRAPIRVVEGFTKIVKEDYGRLLDRVGNDHLDRVLGAAARMNNMIDALLALSKLSSQPLAQQPVNLSQLASFVVDDLRRQWPDREIGVEIESGLQARGDPTLLRVVLENLIGNAWKYTGKAPAPRIAFGRHASAASAFTISDNGAGFDMRFADRLFGVFQRLHSANDFPGTGVGLASVRRIVRRHGGEIWGEGEVMCGASFHFSLPTTAAATAPAPAPAEVRPSASADCGR